jgi:hypothetical protein
MRGRLFRGVAAAVMSSVVLLSGAAQPAQATGGYPELARFSLTVMYDLAIESGGGLLAEELQALVRDTQAALNEAKNEVIDHADRLEVARVRTELRLVAIDASLLNPSYPSQDARLRYAQMAMRVGTLAGSMQREMRTPEAVQDMGYAMIVGYETGLVAYLSQRPPLQVEAASHIFKRDLEYLIDRISRAPECPAPSAGPPEHYATHECRGFGTVATGEERCRHLVVADCPEFEHRYQAEDGSWGPWTSGKLDQQVLKDRVLDNSIHDTAVVTYANLLLFMDEMGFN